MKNELICADCLDYLLHTDRIWDTIFSDPPDNLGLGYKEYNDKLSDGEYFKLLHSWLQIFIRHAKTIWFSFNAKWIFEIGNIIRTAIEIDPALNARLFIQHFTFGQNRDTDCGNGYRPLLRLRWPDAPLFPGAIKVPSWREIHGDKRAAKGGRVPLDAWNFPRVTGNSKQRRSFHPTQLHEGLVERALLLTTKEGGTVLDPFAGTGTTLRVCKRINRGCTLIEIDRSYCDHIAEEHNLKCECHVKSIA
jgi:DNA modification methylase